MRNRYFYGFVYKHDLHTTKGESNPRTGHYSIAGCTFAFTAKKWLVQWLARENFIKTANFPGKRVALTKRELRKHYLGMSIKEFEKLLQRLQEGSKFDLDNACFFKSRPLPPELLEKIEQEKK